jgi:hypothetical protein
MSNVVGRQAVFEAKHHILARAEAKRWDGERLAEQYQRFFDGVVDFAHTYAGGRSAIRRIGAPD